MARVSSEQKRLLQRGAEIRGQTLMEFVVAASEAATPAIIASRHILPSVRAYDATGLRCRAAPAGYQKPLLGTSVSGDFGWPLPPSGP